MTPFSTKTPPKKGASRPSPLSSKISTNSASRSSPISWRRCHPSARPRFLRHSSALRIGATKSGSRLTTTSRVDSPDQLQQLLDRQLLERSTRAVAQIDAELAAFASDRAINGRTMPVCEISLRGMALFASVTIFYPWIMAAIYLSQKREKPRWHRVVGMQVWMGTAIALALLGAVATIGLTSFRAGQAWDALLALFRAILQLGALSLVLTGILEDPFWVGVGLAVMFVVAVATAARRARVASRQLLPLCLSMLLGPVVAMTIVFATGAIEFSARYVLAIGGIVIGNTMTISVLSQRLFRDSVRDHWDEVEGWLALGATPSQSTLELGRRAVATALLPSIDQTRTTGVVVLPGAFVGAIFAGASPLEAGRFQVVVLACILAAGVLTSITLTRLNGAVALRPADVKTT